MNYYKKDILKNLPSQYKLKYEPSSLTPLQQLGIIKIFLEKDEKREGRIPFRILFRIIKENLGFKITEQELIYMLIAEPFPYEMENIYKETFEISILLQIVDILKREKLVLVQLGNSLSYIIFVVVVILLILYLSEFYDYKSRNQKLS